jgi:large subunit ribosomal protein L29
MKAIELKDLSLEELKDKLSEKQADLSKLKLNHAVSPLENPLLLRTTRKDVARIKTEIRKRELAVKK